MEHFRRKLSAFETNFQTLQSMEMTNMRAYRGFSTSRNSAIAGLEQAAKINRKYPILMNTKFIEVYDPKPPVCEDGVQLLPPNFYNNLKTKNQIEEDLKDRKPCIENNSIMPAPIRMADWYCWKGPKCDMDTYSALLNILSVETKKLSKCSIDIHYSCTMPSRERAYISPEVDPSSISVNRILLKLFYPEVVLDMDDPLLAEVLNNLKEIFRHRGRLSLDTAWNMANQLLVGRYKDTLSTNQLTEYSQNFSYLFSSRIYGFRVTSLEGERPTLDHQIKETCKFNVLQALKGIPIERKRLLAEATQTTTILGQPLSKRLRGVAEDKYVTATKLAIGMETSGVITRGRLQLVSQSDTDIIRRKANLPWIEDWKNLPIVYYEGEEILKGCWILQDRVEMILHRRGGELLDQQKIVKLTIDPSFLKLTHHRRLLLFADIAYYARCSNIFNIPHDVGKFKNLKDTFNSLLSKTVKTTGQIAEFLLHTYGPLVKGQGISDQMILSNHKHLSKITLEGLEPFITKPDSTVSMTDNLTICKRKRKLVDFDEDMGTPAKRPLIATSIGYRGPFEVLTDLIHLVYNQGTKEIRQLILGGPYNPLRDMLKRMGNQHVTSVNSSYSCFSLLTTRKYLQKLFTIKLLLGMGDHYLSETGYEEAMPCSPTFFWEGRVRSMTESIDSLTEKDAVVCIYGRMIKPPLPESLKDFYNFQSFRYSEMKTMPIVPIPQVMKEKPEEAIISVGNRELRIKRKKKGDLNLDEEIAKHTDNALTMLEGFDTDESELDSD